MPIERLHKGPPNVPGRHPQQYGVLGRPGGRQCAGKSVTEQAKDILSIIDALLAEAKTDKSRVLSATIWLTDMGTFAEMNKVMGPVGGAGGEALHGRRCRARN